MHYSCAIKLALATTIVISTSALVQAKNNEQSQNGPPKRPSFESLDLNEDGEIKFEEFSSHVLPHGDHQTVFNVIDTDGDSIITLDEFTNHKPPQRKKRRGGEQ